VIAFSIFFKDFTPLPSFKYEGQYYYLPAAEKL